MIHLGKYILPVFLPADRRRPAANRLASVALQNVPPSGASGGLYPCPTNTGYRFSLMTEAFAVNELRHLDQTLHKSRTLVSLRHILTSWIVHELAVYQEEWEAAGYFARQIVHACVAYGPRPLG